jgi:hypothetical protein
LERGSGFFAENSLRGIRLINPAREELKARLAIGGLPSIKPLARNI